MSQKKINYSKSIIYKLCCKDPTIEEIYIGSTSNKRNRKYGHKTDCNNCNSKGYNYFVYQFIRDNGGFQNWDMIIIEEFPCNSKNELECRERYWIETLKPELNKYIPSRTKKEYTKKYYEENKKEINKKNKEYYEENKDYKKKYQKEYDEENKNKIKEYREKNKKELSKKQKEYREENKEKIKEYYQKNKKELNEKIKCEKCNCLISKQNLRAHQKTMKCKMLSECLFSDED